MPGLTHKLRKRVCNMTKPINESQMKGAAFKTVPSEPSVLLNANNTKTSNLRATNLQALCVAPEIMISLRDEFGIEKSPLRIKKLLSKGYAINIVRTYQFSHRSIKHQTLAKFVLRDTK